MDGNGGQLKQRHVIELFHRNDEKEKTEQPVEPQIALSSAFIGNSVKNIEDLFSVMFARQVGKDLFFSPASSQFPADTLFECICFIHMFSTVAGECRGGFTICFLNISVCPECSGPRVKLLSCTVSAGVAQWLCCVDCPIIISRPSGSYNLTIARYIITTGRQNIVAKRR